MCEHLGSYRTALYNAAVLCKIASEHCNAACLGIGLLNGSYDVVVTVYGCGDVLPDGLTRYCKAVCVEKPLLVKLLHYSPYAACLLQILHIGVAGGGKVTQVGCLCTYLIGNVKVYLYAALVGNGREMEHTVGGAAQRHIHRKGVHYGIVGHDVQGTDVLPPQLHYLHTCLLCKAQA